MRYTLLWHCPSPPWCLKLPSPMQYTLLVYILALSQASLMPLATQSDAIHTNVASVPVHYVIVSRSVWLVMADFQISILWLFSFCSGSWTPFLLPPSIYSHSFVSPTYFWSLLQADVVSTPSLMTKRGIHVTTKPPQNLRNISVHPKDRLDPREVLSTINGPNWAEVCGGRQRECEP